MNKAYFFLMLACSSFVTTQTFATAGNNGTNPPPSRGYGASQPSSSGQRSPSTSSEAKDIAAEILSQLSSKLTANQSTHIVINNSTHNIYFTFCSSEKPHCTEDNHSISPENYRVLSTAMVSSFAHFKTWLYPSPSSWRKQPVLCEVDNQLPSSQTMRHGVILPEGMSSVITIKGNDKSCHVTLSVA